MYKWGHGWMTLICKQKLAAIDLVSSLHFTPIFLGFETLGWDELSMFRKSIRSFTNYRFTANTPGMSGSCQWKIAEWLNGSNKCSNEEGNLAKFECKMDWSRTCSITLDNGSLPFRELPNPREADLTMVDYPGSIALFTSASIILGICPTYALWKRVIHIGVLRSCQQFD